jgi:hypothetical protein
VSGDRKTEEVVGGWRSGSSAGSGLEVGGRGKIISDCELRNREPARRVGVRRTIANLKDRGRRTDDRGQKEVRGKMLEVGGAALRALRLEAKDRKKSEVGRLRTDDGGQTSAGRWQQAEGSRRSED